MVRRNFSSRERENTPSTTPCAVLQIPSRWNFRGIASFLSRPDVTVIAILLGNVRENSTRDRRASLGWVGRIFDRDILPNNVVSFDASGRVIPRYRFGDKVGSERV